MERRTRRSRAAPQACRRSAGAGPGARVAARSGGRTDDFAGPRSFASRLWGGDDRRAGSYRCALQPLGRRDQGSPPQHKRGGRGGRPADRPSQAGGEFTDGRQHPSPLYRHRRRPVLHGHGALLVPRPADGQACDRARGAAILRDGRGGAHQRSRPTGGDDRERRDRPADRQLQRPARPARSQRVRPATDHAGPGDRPRRSPSRQRPEISIFSQHEPRNPHPLERGAGDGADPGAGRPYRAPARTG